MSFTENLDNQTDQDQENDTPLVKQLRQQVKELGKANKENSEAVRELAFLKAGVDTDSRVGQLLLKTYDGDLKDVEALKKEAEDLGVLRAPAQATSESSGEPAGQASSNPSDLQGGQSVNMESTGSAERQALANGAAGGDVQPEIPPNKEALDKFKEVTAAGATWDDAAGAFMATLATREAHRIGLTEHRP